MARRSTTTTEAPEVEVTTDDQSEVVTESQTSTEQAEPEIDLTAFQNAAKEAVSSANDQTGEPTEEGLAAANEAYRELDGVKAKNAAKTWLDDQMKAAIQGQGEFESLGDFEKVMTARSYVNLREGLTAAKSGGSSTATPADPTEAFVQKLAQLNIATDLLTNSVPEGVSDDWAEKVDALVTELASQVEQYKAYNDSDDEDAEAPEVNAVVRGAFKIAKTRAASGGTRAPFTGTRRDIVKHIEQVFASQEPGAYLTVNEIAKSASTEYGDDRPSAGAVSARLFPKGKEPFVGETFKAVPKDGERANGAVRL